MDERDFERIGQLVAQVVDSRLERIDARFDQIDERFIKIDERFEKIDERFEKIDERFEKIDERFVQIDRTIAALRQEFKDDLHHSLGLERETIQRDIKLLAEGQQMLLEKVDRLEVRVDNLEVSLGTKIDTLAVGLAAHRLDPEAHQRVYRVREFPAEYGEDATPSLAPSTDTDKEEQ